MKDFDKIVIISVFVLLVVILIIIFIFVIIIFENSNSKMNILVTTRTLQNTRALQNTKTLQNMRTFKNKDLNSKNKLNINEKTPKIYSSHYITDYNYLGSCFDFDSNIQKNLNNIVIKSQNYAEDSIFISISSYRDPELCNTINDLWLKAYNNKRIIVGIVQQNNKEDDNKICFGENSIIPKQNLRIINLNWTEAKGPTYARSICEKSLENEKYYLLCDSHIRFEQGWDIFLIKDIEKCYEPEKSILTVYPSPFQRIENKSNKSITYKIIKRLSQRKCSFNNISNEGFSQFKSYNVLYNSKIPQPSGFWAAGFSFSYANLVRKVPFLNNTPFLFIGEESAMAMKYFTNGYNLFTPTKNFVYHLWDRSYRKTFWSLENRNLKNESVKRVSKFLLGKYISKNEKRDNLVLGNERTIEDFELYTGINFKIKSTIRNLLGTWNLPKELEFFINKKLSRPKKLDNIKYYTSNFSNVKIIPNKMTIK